MTDLDDPRGTTLPLRLRPLVRWGVPAWAAALVGLGALSITVLRAPVLGTVLLLLPLALGALVLELFGYRAVAFRAEGLTLRRWLFPDRSYPYSAVDALDETGCRVGGRPVRWEMFTNGDDLADRFRALAEAGVLDAEVSAGKAAARRAARQKAAVLIVGAAVGLPAGLGVAEVDVDPLFLLLAVTAGGVALFPALAKLFERRGS